MKTSGPGQTHVTSLRNREAAFSAASPSFIALQEAVSRRANQQASEQNFLCASHDGIIKTLISASWFTTNKQLMRGEAGGRVGRRWTQEVTARLVVFAHILQVFNPPVKRTKPCEAFVGIGGDVGGY